MKKSFDAPENAILQGAPTSAAGAGGIFDEAVEALMVLGYNIQKARQAVELSYAEGMSLEETVKAALKSGV